MVDKVYLYYSSGCDWSPSTLELIFTNKKKADEEAETCGGYIEEWEVME